MAEPLARSVVRVRGRDVTLYRRPGRGTVELVALHGGFTDPLMDLAALAERLDERISVTLPVLRGHAGGEVEPGEAIGPASLARDTAALVEAMGWERPVLGGFSLGARAAMLAAADGIDTAALVLVGPRFRAFTTDDFRTLEEQVIRLWPEWAGPERQKVVDAMVDGIVDFEIAPEPWARRLGRDVPVLAMRGGEDRICSAEELERVRTPPADARIASLAGHGHRVQVSAANDVAGLIERFLGGTGVL